MNGKSSDTVSVRRFDKSKEEIHLRLTGIDRPNVISEVAGRLEKQNLYVSSIAFNLMLPNQDEYEMEVVAKGSLEGLQAVEYLIEVDRFIDAADYEKSSNFFWAGAYLFHIGLFTPDREGLTAKVSSIVGKPREVEDGVCPNGSFVHMLGITHNSDGPHGGTPYFDLRANVATQKPEVQTQIIAHLYEWALKYGIEGDLWIRDLNRDEIGISSKEPGT